MLFGLFDILQCCNKTASTELKVTTIGADSFENSCCRRTVEQDLKVVHITADVQDPLGPSTSHDPYGCKDGNVGPPPGRFHAATSSKLPALTPRQRDLKERVRLPVMLRYPVPQECSQDDPADVRAAELLRIFQAFVLDLNKGVYMTQVNACDEYSDIHCQLQDDLQTLKVDQGSGCIVEFPLTAVTRIYRIVRNDGPTPIPDADLDQSDAEHIVVVEFMRRKLVLVFGAMLDAQSFIMCTELLVRFAQEVSNVPTTPISCSMDDANRPPPEIPRPGGHPSGNYQHWTEAHRTEFPPFAGAEEEGVFPLLPEVRRSPEPPDTHKFFVDVVS